MNSALGILLLFISIVVLGAMLILRGKKGPSPLVRPLPAFQDIRAETGYAAESGGAIHIALGSGALYGGDAVTSLAALQIAEALANTAISYDTPPIITVGDPTLLPLAEDTLRRVYERNGIIELYDSSKVRFIAHSPVAYAAGAGNVVATEDVTANIMAGDFGPEVSLIADAGARQDLAQLAAVTAPAAIGALYPAANRLAVGEELFAAGAHTTDKRHYQISLVVQDIMRVIIVGLIILSILF